MQQSQTDAMEGSHSCPASSGGKLGAGWQITMGDTWLCPLCRTHEESANHSFISCPGSIVIWCIGPWPVSTVPFKDLLYFELDEVLAGSRNLPRGRGHRED